MQSKILDALVERGHTLEHIKQMPPEEAFDEYCNWHGLIHWGPRLRGVLDNLKEAAQVPDQRAERARTPRTARPVAGLPGVASTSVER